MTGPDEPRSGRQSSSGPAETSFTGGPGFAAPRYEPGRYEPPSWTVETGSSRVAPSARTTAGFPRVSGLLDRSPDETGPLVEPEWWSYASGDHPQHLLTARHSRDESPGDAGRTAGPGNDAAGSRHPSAPLPPMPSGVWDRLQSRHAAPDDAATVAQPAVPGGPSAVDRRHDADDAPDDDTEALPPDPRAWEDQTGGLDVIGAHVAEEPPRRRGRRARREAAVAGRHGGDPDDLEHDVLGADGLVHDEHFGEDIPVTPFDPRAGRSRRRRRPFAILFSLLVLAGLVVGIVVGGQKLLTLIDPSSRDFTGQGTGTF